MVVAVTVGNVSLRDHHDERPGIQDLHTEGGARKVGLTRNSSGPFVVTMAQPNYMWVIWESVGLQK